MKKTTDEGSTKIERAPFDLKLPPEIDVKPWQVVELPRNKQAMIYKIPTNHENAVEGVRYDVYLVSKKTLKSGDTYTGRSSQGFNTIAAMKHWLYDMVAHLSVQRSTIKKVNVVDLQDNDDDD